MIRAASLTAANPPGPLASGALVTSSPILVISKDEAMRAGR
jgi:hypothetical protein